jgi:hypothetical protein
MNSRDQPEVIKKQVRPRVRSRTVPSALLVSESASPTDSREDSREADNGQETFSRLALNAPFLEPGRNLNQQIVN